MPAGKRKILRVLAAGLLLCAGVARADFREDYAHGVRAYEDGDYGTAQKLLQQALEAHSEPSARMRLYGQIFKPYIPQHYLGLLALQRGDCAPVRAPWGSSDNRQILLQLADIAAEEEKAGSACASAVAKAGDKSAPPEIPAAPAPPKSVVVAPVPKPVTPPPPPPKPPAEKPPVEKPVVAEKSPPPDSLVQAFDQFLTGRYADVARINADAYADAHARFHAYLVRAAAKYTQARMSADETMLASAKADAVAARALDAHTLPDATLFSPAFREFYAAAK